MSTKDQEIASIITGIPLKADPLERVSTVVNFLQFEYTYIRWATE